MGITIHSVFQPLNEYFLQKYQTESDVFFRFDKIGSSITDEDFINEAFINDVSKKKEAISEIVNSILIEEPDNINIVRSGNKIDQFYINILKSSLPAVEDTEPDAEHITNNFISARSDAYKKWEVHTEAGSSEDGFRASATTPENWFDPANTDGWTKHSFQVSEKTEILPPSKMIWRLKLDDAVLSQFLARTPSETIKPIQLHERIMMRKKESPFLLSAAALSEAGVGISRRARPRVSTRRASVTGFHRSVAGTTAEVAEPVRTFKAHSKFINLIKGLNLSQRYEVSHFIKENAPMAPSETKEVKIDFEYCLVSIDRPWLLSTFFYNKSWYLPRIAKGELSQPGKSGGLTSMPVAFLAVRNLNIEASWSQVDIDNAKNASDFGPFEVNSEIINNKLSHPGTQIIGWVLERLPVLPPNDPRV